MNFDKPQALRERAAVKPAAKAPLVRVAGTKKVIPVKILDERIKAVKAVNEKKKPVSAKPISKIQPAKKTVSSPPKSKEATPSPYQSNEERATLAREKLRKQIVCAPGEHCFWMCDGRVLADLKELGQALAEIEDEVFSHHVTDNRHDFAQWVEDILCDGDCAKKLRETRNKHDARKVVLQALDLYQ